MTRIYALADGIWLRLQHMGQQEWLLVCLAVVVFGYYCAKVMD